jgi:hypothetical protein
MFKRPLQLSGGALALIVLVLVAAGLAILSQYRGGPRTWLRIYDLQSAGPSQACLAPARLVAGSYQAQPVQVLGGYVLLTYTAQCAQAGQPAQGVQGFAAFDRNEVGCAGSGLLPPVRSAGAADPVTIDGLRSGRCGSAASGGQLSVVIGQITGGAAVQVQVQYTSGRKVNAPLQQGHFGLGVVEDSTVCAIRALDASGITLAETGMGALGEGECKG